ncbi:MAG: alpha/beta fold hydrolase [Gammaproteobacteria bacterium]
MQPQDFPSKWLFPVKENEKATIQLICFPFAGGGASVYSSWQESLSPTIQLRPVQLPGRENRFGEPAINRFETILARLVSVIKPLTKKRWAVFGHSMGALLAAELVIQLMDEGCCIPPEHVFLSGKSPLHLPSQRPLIGNLNDDDLLTQLQLRYGAQNTPEQKELMRLMLNTIRADVQIVESHIRSKPLSLPCPITAILGTDDLSVTVQDMQQWKTYTNNHFSMIKIPGDHFYLQSSRKEITACINQKLCD